MKIQSKQWIQKLALIAVISIAFSLRLYGLDWDQGNHLHPDERFLSILTNDVSFPESWTEYLNPSVSKLNPYNIGKDFYVYGILPVTLNKITAQRFDMDTYAQNLLTGRILSALADIGTLFFVMLLVKLWEKQYKIPSSAKILAGFFYAIAVLPIQHAHFFTVDSFTTLFVTGSVYFAFRYIYARNIFNVLGTSILIGLGISCKVSAIYVVPLIGLLYIIGISKDRSSILRNMLLHGSIFLLFTYVTVRVASPYYFENASWLDASIHPMFARGIEQLKVFASPDSGFYPPAMQWLSKKPFFFAFNNLAIFGLGVPYFLLMVFGMITIILHKKPEYIALCFWVLVFFFYQSIQFSPTMRYFYMLYPYFAIFAGLGLMKLIKMASLSGAKKITGALFICAICSIWTGMFMHIYSVPHSRVSASLWMFENIPANATISGEHWDDPLPLQTGPIEKRITFNYVEMPVFAEDTAEKWNIMNDSLSKTDYYIMSSNRGYGSILPIPDKYPIMSEFYTQLMNGSAGFQLVQEFTSYPSLCIPLSTLCVRFPDQWADEAFTVYDHPKVSIYRKIH